MKFLNSWQIFAVASAAFAGVTALFGKIGVLNVNSNLATLIRVGVILIVTILVVLVTNQWQSPQSITPKTWIFLALSGITTALSWLCYYRALQLGPVSKVTSVDKLSIAIAIVLGVVILGEKLSWKILMGAGLITLGAILIAH